MLAIKFIIPEIFLSVSIFSLLMFGVFVKNSFEIIYRLTIFVIFLLLTIILSGEYESVKIFNENFVIDKFSLYSKVLILASTFFVLLISKKYIVDIKANL